MTTHEDLTTQAAREFHATLTALRTGNASVDEARRRNRALRERVGDETYDAAKVRAIVIDHNAHCS